MENIRLCQIHSSKDINYTERCQEIRTWRCNYCRERKVAVKGGCNNVSRIQTEAACGVFFPWNIDEIPAVG